MDELLDEIRYFLREDFERFDELFEGALTPQLPYIDEARVKLYKGGKKLRPILLLLSAHLNSKAGKELELKVIQAAVSLEMMHVATLIHDDIIDDAPIRRGAPTVNSEMGMKQAVLIGDMQFIQAVRGFLYAIEDPEDLGIVQKVMDVGFDICRGEFDELKEIKEHKWKELERRYLRTIDRKTAQLFGVSCEAGAYLTNASEKSCYYLSRFGRLFGTAFQIIDDISDFTLPSEKTGKIQTIDLSRGRLTFPIILALQEFPPENMIHRCLDQDFELDEEEIKKLALQITQSNAMVTSYNKAKEYLQEAKEFLQFYPDSSYLVFMHKLVESVSNDQNLTL